MKSRIFIVLSCFSFLTVIDAQQAKPNQKKPHPGRDRYFTIMYKGKNGIESYNKNITYAETLNLSEDVSLPAIALYFPTITDAGQTFLLDTLQYVISPKDTNSTVARRAQDIAFLVKKPQIYQEIKKFLQQAKEQELLVLDLMTNRERALEKLKMPDFESFTKLSEFAYVPWNLLDKYIAENPWVNAGYQLFNITAVPTLAATAAGSASMAYDEWTKPDFKYIDSKKVDDQIQRAKNLAYTPIELITDPSKFNTETLKDKIKSSLDLKKESIQTKELKDLKLYALTAATSAAAAENRATAVYDDYQEGLKNRQLIHALYRLVTIAEQLETICAQHDIQTQFKPSSITNPDALAMIEGLKHPRYQNKEESFVISTPWINTFVNDIYKQDIYLAPFFALIAEMDTYHAIATRMIEQADKPNKLCFAQILQQAKPKFEAKGFWNVMIKDPVPNSLIEDRLMILTGPNAGGKSTVLRSILQNIIFSQTFGFAAAEFFASTPYDVVESSLRISDDLSKGLSRYASELKRGNDTVVRAKTLRPDEKFFFVLDELFTGTNAQDGQTAAYELVNDDLASNFNQIQFIFATHFDKLKELEKANPTKFVNYKIDAPIISAQGKLVYPYTLSKGVNSSYIALQMKREAGLVGNNKSGKNVALAA